MSALTVDISDRIATITLNRPRTLNALTAEDYDDLATALREIDAREDVLVTVWQAHGKWFCAGTDVKSKRTDYVIPNIRGAFLSNVARTTTDCGHALSSHSKILVAALNGPVMGIAAAFLGHFDFIYCMPTAWLSLPFTFLGIVAEGGSSASFVNRMGLAKANEVLLWGQKKEAQELFECGFVNRIFPAQSVDSFHVAVRKQLLDDLHGLDPSALLEVKKLIRAGLKDKNDPDAVNLRESYAQAARFASGVPMEQFAKIARKQVKHKL
ncbi:putative enoyl-CoA hydratase/isomerase [Lyophyllum shimeji]|uniref:Enoyl-CoA hydratase/isomerase n=1 Tax=Lyophyllum shimeji TaxID=47721 RepID=A0A9P3PGH0_LYOSH|nr:putative enoyl-CoA hydratase/isomerase [Lyophyllum shimeji]